MNADAQTTATCGECRYVPMGNAERGEAFIRLCSRHAHVDALADRNGALAEVLQKLSDAAESHVALQDKATDPRIGITQPITVAEGEALNDALDEARAALSGQPVDTEFELRVALHRDDAPAFDRAALSGEAGDTEAERVRERARERRG